MCASAAAACDQVAAVFVLPWRSRAFERLQNCIDPLYWTTGHATLTAPGRNRRRMWRNLSLRTRILLGFGLVLLVAAALALFLVLRVADLNSRIKQLNTSATFEATTGAHVAAQVAASQRLVERYISQPQQDNLQSAQF